MSTLDDTQLQTRPAPEARQTDIYYDDRSYSAFPHVVRLGGTELLIAFRQAPRKDVIYHTHPRSVITVMSERGWVWRMTSWRGAWRNAMSNSVPPRRTTCGKAE